MPTPAEQRVDGTVTAAHGMVCSVDRLATDAGVDALRNGGSAVDAAIATNAVLTVTAQHMCGLGGDLLALIHDGSGDPHALLSVGPAGSGADASQLRAEGHRHVPRRNDVRAVTVPGCVDGWLALHERFGRLPFADLLAPAGQLANNGFAASPLLAGSARRIEGVPGADDYVRPGGLRPGERVTRPLVAATLDAIAGRGRESFYGGAFGEALIALGAGLFTESDLAQPLARWAAPISGNAWGHRIWTTPPPSQGYLIPASAWIADGLPLPGDPDDPAWPHLLAEAASWAGHDRPDVLHEHADGRSLLAESRLAPRRASIATAERTAPPTRTRPGGTTYLCAVDATGMAVSLINSNAAGWGAHIVAPGTGIFLQNRGLGFNLEPGHPAELAPGRRPPHTLAPALVTTADRRLRAVLGTMGGDSQPQIVLQLLARLLHGGQPPGTAVAAPRWFLGDGGFDIWAGAPDDRVISLERSAPQRWAPGLRARGHTVRPDAGSVGHAHVIIRRADGLLAGAADPRAKGSLAAGI